MPACLSGCDEVSLHMKPCSLAVSSVIFLYSLCRFSKGSSEATWDFS